MDFDKEHLKRIAQYERQIQKIYEEAVNQAALLGLAVPNFDPNKPFYFADYPMIKQRIDKLINWLYEQVHGVIINGIDAEWTLANNKNNELARIVFGENLAKLPKPIERKYFSTNNVAKEAFKRNKFNGHGLSDRIWKYTGQHKVELEMGLDLGLRNGLSASEMSRDMRSYLHNPNKLFRRVRDEHGNLHLSKRAKAYNPGRGVYRSSYKNALRMTGETVNNAYRDSDYERRQQLDFIVGVHIELSNNHTINGESFTDICDHLQGDYPKDYVFRGWHVKCRCKSTSILKTPEEMQRDNELILDGKEPLPYSSNLVKKLPANYHNWLDENKNRIEAAKSLPNFIKDNHKYQNQASLKLVLS